MPKEKQQPPIPTGMKRMWEIAFMKKALVYSASDHQQMGTIAKEMVMCLIIIRTDTNERARHVMTYEQKRP